ncbi:NACHT domain-containing protein [Pseudomonas sp. GL-B-19]|uniref:NACHT domain-containing protein n=1 Tax=Pseudomonas sp. GL-B-19 TaxID=2832393 RepID=UPI001CC169B4|nr:NACHT domain-containing protein [Pseudomonas sp. GL-B-19]
MSALSFELLNDDEDPSLGIFFLQSRSSFVDGYDIVRKPDPESATGMAFLITQQGILATCRHVVDALALRPGDQVRLYGLSSRMPITVQAQVLDAGSAGVSWDLPVTRRQHPAYKGVVDMRDDVLGEDLALLKIIPGTARAHVIFEGETPQKDARGRVKPLNAPEHWLYHHARVLPAGPPGYSAPGRQLLTWRGVWVAGAPVMEQAKSTFQGLAHSRHRLVHVRSDEIFPGFSGAPLWDDKRRLVVAIVRQHLAAGTTEIGATDVRALEVCPGFVLAADRPLRQALAFAAAELEAAMPQRHSALLEWAAAEGFVEPQLRAARDGDSLTQDDNEHVMSALQLLDAYVRQGAGLILTGQAGSGKSTLLRAFCRKMLETSVIVAGRRLVPFIVHASAFVSAHFDLRQVLEGASARLGVGHMDAPTFISALLENDARIVLLLDSLDEVKLADQNQMLARLSLQAQGVSRRSERPLDRLVHSVLIMSRPSGAIKPKKGITPGGYHVYEVRPFDAPRIQALAALLYSDQQKQSDFLGELQRLRWYRNGASPIQVRIAAMTLAFDAQLPDRPSDLVVNVIELMFKAAQKERGPGEGLAIYRDEIIGYLAREELRESWSLNYQNLHDHFSEVSSQPESPQWMSDAQALLTFIFEELPSRAPVLAIDESKQLQWLHRSFVETLAAKWEVRGCVDDHALMARVEQTMQPSGEGHLYALALLAAMERGNRLTAVQKVLECCLQRPVPGVRAQLLALRALADGIDAGGTLRQAQVKLLIRIIVTAQNESMACQEIFSMDELSDPWEILERPELRADVLAALEARFAARRSRLGAKPLRVLDAEARILDRLQLWSSFRNLVSGTQPSTSPALVGLPMGIGGQGIDGYTQLELRRADGAVDLLQMGITDFIDRVRQADLQVQGRTSAELVSMVVHLMVNEVRER